jgi:tetratricopeptide (TPR) repeat protein
MRWIAAVVLCVLLGVRAGLALPQALDHAALGEAEALVRAGKAEQAWALLAPLEREHAGRPDFDYLLGLAALESGRPNRATFVLERVITVNPGHLAARLEMARAYFALNDFERAEREFGFILQSAPPAEIRSLSETYLERIRTASRRRQSGLSGYVEAAFGRDTNVSAAAAQSSIFVPALGVELTPDPAFQRRPDEFVSLAAGLEYAHALGAGLALVAGADVRQRWHSDAEAFDFRAVDLHLLLNQRLGERDGMQYSLGHGDYQLDDRRYRETQSLGAQWTRNASPATRIAFSGQGHRIRYRAPEARAASSDLIAAGASASHLLQPSSLTIAFGGLYAGYDHAVAGRVDGDRRILGVSLGLQRRVLTRVEAMVRLSLLDSDYKTQNVDFGVTRHDHQLDAALGVGWEFADGWLLRAQVARTANHSNLALNDYRRTESSIALQRIWD